MKTIVVYKSKYGSTKTYAEWIAGEISCEAVDAKNISAKDLAGYDAIVYGGGLYAEIIGGLCLITKNIDLLKDKKIAVYSCGITPLDCREYYDKMVIEKNFKKGVPENVRVFNFMGKMILDELSVVHRTALKTLKKIMSSKENPTEMEKMLIDLCDADGDFTDKASITGLIDYIRN
ncbi:MAG: flavodoxin [Clostridia bacterium]|nr:flavodoxin [Clostridia bacterium]